MRPVHFALIIAAALMLIGTSFVPAAPAQGLLEYGRPVKLFDHATPPRRAKIA